MSHEAYQGTSKLYHSHAKHDQHTEPHDDCLECYVDAAVKRAIEIENKTEAPTFIAVTDYRATVHEVVTLLFYVNEAVNEAIAHAAFNHMRITRGQTIRLCEVLKERAL